MALKVIGVNMIDVLLESVLECPVCGFAKRETMPTGKRCQVFYECVQQMTVLRSPQHHASFDRTKARCTPSEVERIHWQLIPHLNGLAQACATHAALSHYAFDAEGRGGPDIQITNGMAAHRLPSTTLPSPTVGWVQKSMVCS